MQTVKILVQLSLFVSQTLYCMPADRGKISDLKKIHVERLEKYNAPVAASKKSTLEFKTSKKQNTEQPSTVTPERDSRLLRRVAYGVLSCATVVFFVEIGLILSSILRNTHNKPCISSPLHAVNVSQPCFSMTAQNCGNCATSLTADNLCGSTNSTKVAELVQQFESICGNATTYCSTQDVCSQEAQCKRDTMKHYQQRLRAQCTIQPQPVTNNQRRSNHLLQQIRRYKKKGH